jgi:phosphoserine phosphatase RsbU/P
MRRLSFDLTFRTKLLLSMCAVVLLTGAIVIAVADQSSRESTNILVNSIFREVSKHTVSRTKDFVQRAAPVAESLAQLANDGLAMDDLDRLAPQLLAFLKGNADMTWVLYGDESGDYTGATRLHDGHLHIERTHIVNGKTHLTEYEVESDGSWKIFQQDDNRGYDPRNRPFYILAKEKGKLAWTQPYMFFSQGVPGISCVIPVKNSAGKMRGVFSVEFDLNALSEFVSTFSISEHSRVFLFTPDQTLIAHPNERNLAGKGVKGSGAMLTLADTGDPLVDAFRQHLRPEYVNSEGHDRFHFFEFSHNGVGYLASTTVFAIGDGQPWVVGVVAAQSDFLAAVWRTRWLSLVAAAAAMCIAAIVAAAMSRRISRPVQSLIGFMQRVGGGDLDARADFGGGREFRQLSDALNQMISDLRERLRLRNSLQLAMDVQKSLLPAADPISPPLDIAGRSYYCDETGGDYFDFIDISTVSPSSLLIAVGDVMGHGIPAALLMATARAALRTSAQQEHSLADLMTRTNNILAADNRHNRFMTLSLLMIDSKSRVARWASAGHDPAIVFDPETDSFHELEGGGLPLGVMENTDYEEYTSEPLPLNGILLIGTDGVWEMFNEKKDQYGKDRLRDVMRAHHEKPAAMISAALNADLAAFRGLEIPADDVTFVVVRFNGPEMRVAP